MPATDVDADLNELLTRTIGPACHELRSPLAVVYGFAKMLEGSKTIDDTSKRFVGSIVESAQRLDELLDELGGIGRIAAGRARPTTESVQLRDIVSAVREQPENASRMLVRASTDEVHVRVDAQWAREALAAVVASLCIDEAASVDVDWSSQPHEVALYVRPRGEQSWTVDVTPEKSSLRLALARMRLTAMGASIDGEHDGAVRISLPR